ncbi:MAG: hypothetical protein Q8J64_00155 [Thermodesulfovibrionales bacterium]|nr:hypothetical protein [Thermodesulfovibrionales bacterium]
MRRLSERGFTLIEVIMIIVVAGIAIPVLVMLMGRQAQLGVNPELSVTASNLGQSLMEEIKSKSFAGAGAYNGYSDAPSVGGVQYERTVEVCYVPGTDLNNTSSCGVATKYRRIKVRVSYALPENKQSYAEIVTLMTDYAE